MDLTMNATNMQHQTFLTPLHDDDPGASLLLPVDPDASLLIPDVNANRSVGRTVEQTNVRYLTVALYLLTFFIGALGNAILMFVIARYRDIRRNSVANYYIFNLALADELFICTLPLFCHATYTSSWVFGNPMCKIASVLKESNKFGSIFSLVALSVDRVLASYPTLRHFRSILVGKVTCFVVWVLSLVMCTPYFMYSYSAQIRPGQATCRINWPVGEYLYHRRIWTYLQLSLGLILPFVAIIAAYGLLVARLRAVTKARARHRIKKPWRKLTVTVVIIVVAFLVCHVPYYVIDVFSLVKVELVERSKRRNDLYLPSSSEWNTFVYCHAIAQVLVFIGSCCNPVLYGIFNENFRHLYQRLFCCQLPSALAGSSLPEPDDLLSAGDATVTAGLVTSSVIQNALHSSSAPGVQDGGGAASGTASGAASGAAPCVTEQRIYHETDL